MISVATTEGTPERGWHKVPAAKQQPTNISACRARFDEASECAGQCFSPVESPVFKDAAAVPSHLIHCKHPLRPLSSEKPSSSIKNR